MAKKEEIVLAPQAEIVPAEPKPGVTPTAILDLMHAAINNKEPETFKALASMVEGAQERQARAEFNSAMSRFQAACPAIPHNCEQSHLQVTRNGQRRNVTYADLTQVIRHAGPHLRAEGFSWTWDSKVDGEMMTTTCTLMHEGGFSRYSSHTCPTRTPSKTSPQQAHAAAESFAMRRSFIQATGISTAEEDDDGAPTKRESITENQAANLEALITEVGEEHRSTLLSRARVSSIEELPADRFDLAVKWLEGKR